MGSCHVAQSSSPFPCLSLPMLGYSQVPSHPADKGILKEDSMDAQEVVKQSAGL